MQGFPEIGEQRGKNMKNNSLQQLGTLGQSIWLDYIRRDLIAGGGLRRLIEEDGLRGMTSIHPSSRRRSWTATITTRTFGLWRLKGKALRQSMKPETLTQRSQRHLTRES